MNLLYLHLQMKEAAICAVNPHLYTIATLTGHAVLTAGNYSIGEHRSFICILHKIKTGLSNCVFIEVDISHFNFFKKKNMFNYTSLIIYKHIL